MKVKTIESNYSDNKLLNNYLSNLIDCFFKILPMKEEGERSLQTYMRSLQVELIGFKALISFMDYDALFMTLLAILQYLIDTPDCETHEVRREVFRAISICNKLKARYFGEVAD